MVLRRLFFVIASVFSVAQAAPCDLRGEALVVRCASDLVRLQFGDSKYYNNYTAPDFSLREIVPICNEYAEFKKCSQLVDDQCRTTMIRNLMSLWHFACDEAFVRTVSEQHNCFVQADENPVVQKCLGSVFDGQNSISAKHPRCEHAKKHLHCLTTPNYFKSCRQAVKLQQMLFSHVFRESADCDLPTFSDLERQNRLVEQERSSEDDCEPLGPDCKCRTGFRPDKKAHKCIDINECAEGTAPCSQLCQNTRGAYSCSCDGRFYHLAADNHSCERLTNDSTPSWLYFAHGQSIWNISESGRDFQLVRMGLQKTAMLDIDVKEQKLYYADIGEDKIERKNINGAFPQPLQTYEVDGVEGIAVDWVGRNLYSVRKGDVIVQSLEGRYRKTLYKGLLSMPRAIVVDALHGMLYGTDWSSDAFIFKAAADGSRFEKLVTTNIVWPNALALDVARSKLYWADAFLDTIQSVDLDGSNRKTVISDPDAVPHVFGLTIMDDFLYWTDWTYRGILRANKFTGGNITVLAQTALLPYGIKVFHPSVQPEGQNPCESASCSQLCLIGDSGTRAVCACTDGFTLGSDGKTCQSACASTEILCGGSDPKCVSKRYLCDSVAHCADHADEENCPPRICVAGQFQCHDNKKCLAAINLCNGSSECEDGSDEMYCSGVVVHRAPPSTASANRTLVATAA